MDNKNWNDWKFNIHWNKLEWVNKKVVMNKKLIFVCLLKSSIRKILIKLHIGFVKLNQKPLETDNVSKRKQVVDDGQDSSIGTKFEQSASRRKKNPDLLQEYEEQESKEVNDDSGFKSRIKYN